MDSGVIMAEEVAVVEERPLLKEFFPGLHDFLVDPWGRLWGGWRYPKEEKEEPEVRPQRTKKREIEIARGRPGGVTGVTVVEIPEALKKPEIEIEW